MIIGIIFLCLQNSFAGRGCFQYQPPDIDSCAPPEPQKVKEIPVPPPAPVEHCKSEAPSQSKESSSKKSTPFSFCQPGGGANSPFGSSTMDITNFAAKPSLDSLPLEDCFSMFKVPFGNSATNKPTCACVTNIGLSAPPNNRFADCTSPRSRSSRGASSAAPKSVECVQPPVKQQADQCSKPQQEQQAAQPQGQKEMTEEEKFKMVNKVCETIPNLFSSMSPEDLFNPVGKIESLGIPVQKYQC
ncbi:uncharacterized protein MONOS_3255 [Monocercomonoides exilis]|uniref:uncharacterized protein n=1 Tax=Monocercomonoides exilis TaxID=2049356 RepID=UPI003559F4B5|nr:hypothetical protein MONOS_3255 [Monocercomonoides exilis]|eukprot:MONOS_3255.1-p1 / transcript=MONOS_3255.1 / gene=MONOS_3255 / organism=Monocercomonoides_exilis_PA203 / gene_product=unspecified product / transcript_product=unspecified product / location=Mono_scaffold00075:72464-73363(+) / protein_length=244 / sequence_SO=supercontig / SO=protein_coding / is_pseudo=false